MSKVNIEDSYVMFQVYGAYCLGNLASDTNVCKVLVEQGALTKLLEILQKPVSQHVKKATLSAVTRFVSSLNDNIRFVSYFNCKRYKYLVGAIFHPIAC